MIGTGMIDLRFYLTYNGATTLLTNSPDGWNDEAVKWERDMKYFGMFRKFTIPLQFVRDGAKIVRTAFYTYGINADVQITVEKRNIYTNQFVSKYTGILDFATFKDTWDYVEIMCNENGLSYDVKRLESTKFDIAFPSISQQKAALVTFQGEVSNYETTTFVSPAQLDDDEVTNPAIDPNTNPRPRTIKFDENDFKNLNDGTLHFSNYKNDPAYTWGIVIDRNCELIFDVTPNGRSFSIKQGVGHTGWMNYKESLVMDRGGIETELAIIAHEDSISIPLMDTWYEFFPGSVGQQSLPLSGTYQFIAGDKISLRCTITSNDSYGASNYFTRFTNNMAYVCKVKIFDRLSEIVMEAWKPIDLLAEIVKKIGAQYAVKSDFLTARETLILPADTCREEINANAITHTSLEDFFTSFFVTEEIGMGVEEINGVETLVIEPLSYFLNTAVAHNVGVVNGFDLTVATDLMISDIEIGFLQPTFQSYFGKQEIHGTSTFQLPCERITNSVKWISPYRSDILGIDQIRLKQLMITKYGSSASETKDTEDDLAIFLLDCKYIDSDLAFDNYVVNRDYDITPLAYPDTVANVRFTPRRCIQRHGAYIRAICHLLNSEALTHVAGTKNYEYETLYTGETVYQYETADVEINLLPTALFKPYYLNFVAPSPWVMNDNIALGIYDCLQFEYRGQQMYGFIVTCDQKLAVDGKSTFKLLCAPATDLTTLIL
jgi:hypothetical protein